MKVDILLRNKTTLHIERVKKVTNASTNINTDWIYVYVWGDEPGKPRFRFSIDEIICVEVKEC